MGRKRLGGLKTRMGQKCCVSRERARQTRLNSGGIQVEETKEEVTVLVGVGPPEKARTQRGGHLQE